MEFLCIPIFVDLVLLTEKLRVYAGPFHIVTHLKDIVIVTCLMNILVGSLTLSMPMGSVGPSGRQRGPVAILPPFAALLLSFISPVLQMGRSRKAKKGSAALGHDGRELWAPSKGSRTSSSTNRRSVPSTSKMSGPMPSASPLMMAPGKGDKKRFVKRTINKQRRSTTRLNNFNQTGESKEGFLRRRTVSEKQAKVYNDAVANYRSFAMDRGLSLDDVQKRDVALDRFLVEGLYFKGEHLQKARTAAYGVAWHYGNRLKEMPLAALSLKGYKRLNPEKSRDAATWEETCLIAKLLIDEGVEHNQLHRFEAGVASLLQFDVYARPAEIMDFNSDFIIPPASKARKGHQACSMMFHPEALGKPSKQQTFDDTVVVGLEKSGRGWMTEVALALKKAVGSNARLFQHLDAAHYNSLIKYAGEKLGLPQVVTAHKFRHGGASVDALNGLEPRKVQDRGRWAAPSSVRRYSKHGRYLKNLEALSDQLVAKAHNDERYLARNVHKLIPLYITKGMRRE